MTLAQQRQYESWAASLLFFGSIVATIANYFTKQGFWHPALTHRGLLTLLLLQPLYVGMVYYIWIGKRWAKILYLLISGIGLLGIFLVPVPVAPAAVKVNTAAQNILSLSCCVLLILSLRQPTPELTE